MKRIVTLWLPLLAAFWLARATLQALLLERADGRLPALVEVAALPALQALALGWLTRSRGRPATWREGCRALLGGRPYLGALLALDLILLALAFALPAQEWLRPALGEAPEGSLTSLAAALQAAIAALLFARVAHRLDRRGGARAGALRLAALAAGLALLASFFAVDWLTLLGQALLPEGSPLLWRLTLDLPALVLAFALLFGAQPVLAGLAAGAESVAARRLLAVPPALDLAAACGWIAGTVSLLDAAVEETPAAVWSTIVVGCALVAATFLLLAGVAALSPLPPADRTKPVR
jgi:hypothetical protein